jgi:hypothetical protein
VHNVPFLFWVWWLKTCKNWVVPVTTPKKRVTPTCKSEESSEKTSAISICQLCTSQPDLLLHVNSATQELMQQHKKAFSDMRAYYNGVTVSNLDLIRTLRVEAVELRRRDAASAKLAGEVAAENKRLVEPLAQVWPTLISEI